MTAPEWINDPALAGIDKAKLDFLQMMVFEGKNLTPKEMLPFLMNLAKRGKDNAVSFSKEEMELIVAVVKKNSTTEEIARMDKIMKLMQQKNDHKTRLRRLLHRRRRVWSISVTSHKFHDGGSFLRFPRLP